MLYFNTGQDLAAGVDQGPEVAGQGVDLEVGAGVVVGVKVQGVEVVVQAEANLGVLVKTAKNILNLDQNHQRRMVIRIEYQIIVETVVFNFKYIFDIIPTVREKK